MNKSNLTIFTVIGGLSVMLCLLALAGFYIIYPRYFNKTSQISLTNTAVPFLGLSAPGTPTLTPTPVPTKQATYEERMYLAQPFIDDAKQEMAQTNFQGAINAWDQALEIVPEYADGHYFRGRSFMNMLENENSLETYTLLLDQAHQDIDTAIALNPNFDGNYYFARFKIYDYLASLQQNRVDYASFEQIALENLLASYKLGTTESLANRYVLFVSYNLGRCDEMLEETQTQMAAQAEPSATLNLAMGLYFYCSGDLDKALEWTTEAVRIGKEKNLIEGYCQRSFNRAEVLLSMERYDDALEEINDSIEISPYFCGQRYYLRGLIHIGMGDLQDAQEDLEFGSGQTWDRGGLLSYAQAKIALENGDTETAIRLLQEAETTYPFQDPILRMIQEELENLGGERLEVTTSISIPTPFMIQIP
jgi:tetratricopeptide (TPR) repeat protein